MAIEPLTFGEKREALNPKNTDTTVKHTGGGMTLVKCSRASGSGNVIKVEGILNIKNHGDFERTVKLNRLFIFQHDIDATHTFLLVKNYLQKSKVNVIEWPAQSLNFNPIENM